MKHFKITQDQFNALEHNKSIPIEDEIYILKSQHALFRQAFVNCNDQLDEIIAESDDLRYMVLEPVKIHHSKLQEV